MISITQGYAYVYPHKGIRFSLRYPLRPFVNCITGTGKWLYQPLMLKGIIDKKLQESLMTTLIFEFNNILLDVSAEFKNVYHIDNRDIPKSKNAWYDELHLKSHLNKKVAQKYAQLILEKTKQ